MTRLDRRLTLLVLILSIAVTTALTAAGLPPEIADEIDSAVTEVLEETGAGRRVGNSTPTRLSGRGGDRSHLWCGLSHRRRYR